MIKIKPDKWKHFYVGIVMGIVLQAYALFLLPAHLILASVITLFVVIGISYGFELYSKITGHGHYEVMDAIAAIIGGALGIGLVLLFYKIV